MRIAVLATLGLLTVSTPATESHAIGLSAAGPHDTRIALQYTPEEIRGEESAARFTAFQDSVRFFDAVARGASAEALGILWERSQRVQTEIGPAKKSSLAPLAGLAAMLSGLGLVIAASDQIGNLNDAIDAGQSLGATNDLDSSKTKWQLARGAGLISILTGFMSMLSID